MLILTETTPNPEALKFAPQARLTDGATRAFRREDFEAAESPLAARLFAIAGVARVFVAADFVTVTRDAAGPAWGVLKYEVLEAIAAHLEAGEPALAPVSQAPSADLEEIESEIRQVLSLYVRPGVARDGGDILFERFDPESGVLHVSLHGACGGCPSSRLTLKAGVENLVRRYVPEVLRVEELGEAATPQEDRVARLKAWAKSLGAAGGGRPGTIFTRSAPRPD